MFLILMKMFKEAESKEDKSLISSLVKKSRKGDEIFLINFKDLEDEKLLEKYKEYFSIAPEECESFNNKNKMK